MGKLRPDDEQEGLFIDIQEMLTQRNPPMVVGIAMSLVTMVWWPTRQPFAWDANVLAPMLKAPDATPAALEEHKAAVQTYFSVLDDGRWAPSPRFFSVTDNVEKT